MSSPSIEIPNRGGNITAVPSLPDTERKPLSKKEISADHPTWCPGCGDFSVLALYFKRRTACITFTGARCPSPAVFR